MYKLLFLLIVHQWTAPFRVSPDTSADMYPSICVGEGGDVQVCWRNPDHLWARYFFNGNWSEVSLVDTSQCGGKSFTSSMCKDPGGIIWIAWVDTTEYIRLSKYEKERWITSPPDSQIMGRYPAITSDTSGNIWCIWTSSSYPSYYLASYYNQESWVNPDTLREFHPYDCETYTASIATDNKDNIRVTYDESFIIWSQYYNGIEWSSPESIGACFDFAYPTLCADSSKIYIAWFKCPIGLPSYGSFVTRYRTEDGWSSIIEFPHYLDTTERRLLIDQSICLDEQENLWASWTEKQEVNSSDFFILVSSYNGDNWDTVTVIDSAIGARSPEIAYGKGKVWVVWQSAKEGDFNIYLSYKKILGIEEKIKKSHKLLEVYPNPFSERTAIRYTIHDAGYKPQDFSLMVYDISGRVVRDLTDNLASCIMNHISTVIWDGRDNTGKKVSSGVYFVRFVTGEYNITGKLLIMR